LNSHLPVEEKLEPNRCVCRGSGTPKRALRKARLRASQVIEDGSLIHAATSHLSIIHESDDGLVPGSRETETEGFNQRGVLHRVLRDLFGTATVCPACSLSLAKGWHIHMNLCWHLEGKAKVRGKMKALSG
jgi:hypothetical protein